jgi:hypothetical protein
MRSVLKSLADKFNDLMTPVGIDPQSMLILDPPAKPAVAPANAETPKPETPGA